MKTEDMRKLYEGLKIIFENQTPEEKETLSGDQEAHQEAGEENIQETGGQEEAPAQAAGEAAIRVPENEPSPAEDGQHPDPDPGAEPSIEPASGEAAGEPETSGESDADEASEETSSPEEEKEDFRPEEIGQAVTIAEELGLPQEPVETLFSLIDRDKLVNNEGEIGKEELTNTLKLLEAIVLRKPAETPREDNYGYDPENARQSTGFGKYL